MWDPSATPCRPSLSFIVLQKHIPPAHHSWSSACIRRRRKLFCLNSKINGRDSLLQFPLNIVSSTKVLKPCITTNNAWARFSEFSLHCPYLSPAWVCSVYRCIQPTDGKKRLGYAKCSVLLCKMSSRCYQGNSCHW